MIPLITLLSLLPIEQSSKPALPLTPPAKVGMSAEKLQKIDDVVQQAIAKDQLPGAVVLVLRQGKIAHRKAYGQRSKLPRKEAMTLDTIFDLASLTKPIATATSVMILVENGKLRLNDRASRYLPKFTPHGKDKITIRQLLLHVSGLPPGNSLAPYRQGREQGLQSIFESKLRTAPREKFIYSDLGYVLLGLIVEKVSGKPLDQFAHENVFRPLKMKDTGFRPEKARQARIAPTEKVNGKWLRGTVHDPRARLLGGVAGHAGLFSTADDLAIYAQALLHQGRFGKARILSPAAVRLMTTARKVPNGHRALGWDVDTAYSSNRGELFTSNGFGHTGFTGTSLWIDPPSQTAVIFLSHRVHPSVKGRSVIRLRNQVATLVAASIIEDPLP